MDARPEEYSRARENPCAPGAPVNDARRPFNRAAELALYGIAPLATIVTAPLLAQGLGPVARGQYGVAQVVATFAITLGAWGQAEMYLAEARRGSTGLSRPSVISWVGGTVSAVLAALALIALGLPLLVAILAAIWIPLLTQVNLWRSVAVAGSLLKAPALNNALGPVLRILGFGALFLLGVMTAESAITVYQAAAALAAIATVGLVAWRTRAERSGRTALPALLTGGSSIIAFSILNAITLRSDLIVLQIFAPPVEVGLYAAPASLTTAALALSAGFKSRIQAAAFAPHPMRSLVSESLPVLLLGTLGALVLWFAAPVLIALLFGAEYVDAEPLLRLLGISAVPLLMLDLVYGALVVLARRVQLIAVGAVGAVVMLGGLLVLCPAWGALGAATACIIAYTVTAIVGWIVLLREARREVSE